MSGKQLLRPFQSSKGAGRFSDRYVARSQTLASESFVEAAAKIGVLGVRVRMAFQRGAAILAVVAMDGVIAEALRWISCIDAPIEKRLSKSFGPAETVVPSGSCEAAAAALPGHGGRRLSCLTGKRIAQAPSPNVPS